MNFPSIESRIVPADTAPLRRIALSIILIVLTGSSFLPAQEILTTVSFSGNAFFSQRQLMELVPFSIGKSAPRSEAISERIEALYRNEGFYTAAVDSVRRMHVDDTSSVTLEIFITEGMRTVIGEIRFSGNAVLTAAQIQTMMETAIDDPLQPGLLEADIRSVLEQYARIGYPFAAVSCDSIVPSPDDPSRLIVIVLIDEGDPMAVDEIRVTGNTSTASRVIIREYRMRTGMLFDQDRVDAFRRRLERLQLFSAVSEPELVVRTWTRGDTARGGLRITVTEGNANSFDGVLGYVPSPVPGGSGYLTGDIMISLRNLFGTGRSATVLWRRETALTQELELQYKEPWVFGIPLSMGGSYRQRKQDSTFVRTVIEAQGEFQVSDPLTVAGALTLESVTPSADLRQAVVFRTETVSAGAEVRFDMRDDLRNPTTGFQYIASVQQGNKELTGPEQLLAAVPERSYQIQRFAFDAAFFFPVGFRHVIMAGLRGKQVTSNRLEFSDLYPFGGATSLRGYRENQFFASRFAYITGEYRILTGRASSLFAFVDAGYFSRPADALRNTPGTERSLYGYGTGARIETGLGIMNITFALGQGDSFSAGKIHIGIQNQF